MNNVINSLKVGGISIAVAVLGGIIQALSNYHPTDQVTMLVFTIFGGAVIGVINTCMHKLQGTTVVPVDTTVVKTTVEVPATTTTTVATDTKAS